MTSTLLLLAQVARLAPGQISVRVYDPRFEAVWEQPVYFFVALHALLRAISVWAVCRAPAYFGLGLKVSLPLTYPEGG